MTEKWKMFWIGLGSALASVLAALGLISTLRRKKNDTTEEKIEKTRERIKKSSDTELAALFNKRVKDAKAKGARP